jgi:hypothetical protein
VTAGLRGCLLPLHRNWSLLGCLGADLGDMAGSGQGVDNQRTRHARFAAAEASLAVAYSHWEPAPLLGIALVTPLARPPFGVLVNGQQDESFRPSRIGFIAQLGIDYGL